MTKNHLHKVSTFYIFILCLAQISSYNCETTSENDGGEQTEINNNLDVCNNDLNNCNNFLKTCNDNKESCIGNLQTCINDLNENLNTYNNNISTCNTDKATCNTSLNTCQSDNRTCTQNLETSSTELTTCDQNLQELQDIQYQTALTVDNRNLLSMCNSSNSDAIYPNGNLGIFQDNKFDGQSQISWSVNKQCPIGAVGNGCCLELHYKFSQHRTQSFTPYTGVLSHFSYIPFAPIDASEFDGIGLTLRTIPTVGSSPRISLQLADIGPNTHNESLSNCRDGYFEAPVFEFGNEDDVFDIVNLNFTDFTRPSWYGCNKNNPLETSRIYKFAIVILNTSNAETDLQGTIQISDLHFR